MYGHPSHLNASPSAQLPQLPTLPGTVKSISDKSFTPSLAAAGAAPPLLICIEASALSAASRLALSSASSRWASPQVQSLQALLRLPTLGKHSAAAVVVSVLNG